MVGRLQRRANSYCAANPSGIHIQIRFRTGHISLAPSRIHAPIPHGFKVRQRRPPIEFYHSKRANLLTSIRQTPPSKMSASIDLDVERQGSTAPAAILAQPAYLRPLADHHVLLCTVCGSCYVRKTYERHLREVHRLLGEHKARVLAWLATEPVAETEADVLLPPNGQLFVKGLAVHDGWTCNVGSCIFLTGSRDRIRQHCSKEHLINIKTDAGAASPVKLQTLFVKNPKYFTVVVTPDCPPRTNRRRSPSVPAPDRLRDRFDQAQFSQLSQYNHVQTPQHVSEITPWLTRTGFHIHLAGVQKDDLASSYRVPRADEDRPLALICQSADRLLRAGMDQLDDRSHGTRLHRIDRQELNSFQARVTRQAPLDRLQGAASLTAYSQTWQKAVCFYFRVENDHFADHQMFSATEAQRHTAVALLEEAMAQTRGREASSLSPSDSESDQAETSDDDLRLPNAARLRRQAQARERQERQQGCLDKLTLAFCLALIQHPLRNATFDSPLLAFCAVLAWSPSTGSWMKINNYSSFLSHLVYDAQLLTLLYCRDLVTQTVFPTIGEAILAQRDRWLSNTSRGPLGEVNSWRLYALAVGRDTVNPAQLRWYEDGVTLAYNDIIYQVSYLHDEIDFCLQEAQRIFLEDLCLSLPEVPPCPLEQLVDNWDNATPGWSFTSDPRNSDILGHTVAWLFEHVRLHPPLADQVFRQDPSGGDDLLVRPDFTDQYESAVQRFLEFMLVLVHKGSGQPGRAPEVLGLRWCNVQHDKRNLFVHDGRLLFILTYHKSLSRTHASRFPARFLFPAVAQLLTQYVALVLPFRAWLSRETQNPPRISEYLWSNRKGLWKEDLMSRLMKRTSLLSVGVPTHVQAWRQIAVGIAIKFFTDGEYQGDFDLPGDGDDDHSSEPVLSAPAVLPDVFHFQAAHHPRTGNQSYGGTVNFRSGLTDSGLKAYLRASQWWHRLITHPPQAHSASCKITRRVIGASPPVSPSALFALLPRPSSVKHRRASSSQIWLPLPKRLALRQAPLRHRRRWTLPDAQQAVQRLFGPHATFRSAAQARLIERVLHGDSDVIGVLTTGEGKSLAFMLPTLLPGAGTTVLLIPLVALRQDLVRRCAELRVQFAVWERDMDEDRYLGCPLLLVSLEAAGSPRFRAFLARMDARESLDRIVFDEAHLVLTASEYRPKIQAVKHLRALRCQFVFLSATLPPLMMPPFQHAILVSSPTVVRSLTFRRDLRYEVNFAHAKTDQSFLEVVASGISATSSNYGLPVDPRARAIVYTGTRHEADELAGLLRCETYYSDSGTPEEKTEVLTRWIQGASRTIVATSAFGTGIDYPSVRLIFHVGPPKEVISFAQEVGRAGRDQLGGTSIVVLPSTYNPELALSDLSLLSLPQQVMRSYLALPRCHAAILSRFLDGQPWYCDYTDPQRRCSRCRARETIPTSAPQEQPASPPFWARDCSVTSTNDSSSDLNDATVAAAATAENASISLSGLIMLRQSLRDQERGLNNYVRRLRDWKGCCMIYRLLRGVSARGVDEWHPLRQCRHPRKGQFFAAKRQALQSDVSRDRGGWLAAYTACFSCGQPQTICEQQGQGSCEFPDLVFPTSWAVFHMPNRFGQSLRQITGREFTGEGPWMDWLGKGCELHGLPACQAARITDWVLTQLRQAG